MPKSNTPQAAAETALTTIAGGPLSQVLEVLASIPEADEDPTERMMTFILSQPPENWAALWEGLPNVKDNAGRSFRAYALRSRDSDFAGRLAKYLIVDVDWLDTGERGLLSCSSEISVVQLLRLHAEKLFPCDLQIVAKDKPTKKGHRPIHLHYLNPASVAAGDPTKIVSEQ